MFHDRIERRRFLLCCRLFSFFFFVLLLQATPAPVPLDNGTRRAVKDSRKGLLFFGANVRTRAAGRKLRYSKEKQPGRQLAGLPASETGRPFVFCFVLLTTRKSARGNERGLRSFALCPVLFGLRRFLPVSVNVQATTREYSSSWP